MSLDENLNQRIRGALSNVEGVSEKPMMGGVCFFLRGNMLCGARRHQDGVSRFMFRIGKAQEQDALVNPSAKAVVHGDHKVGGFVHVEASACNEAALSGWLNMCIDHAAGLPAKD